MKKTVSMLTSDAFHYMFDVMSDIVGFAEMEISRCIVSNAKV